MRREEWRAVLVVGDGGGEEQERVVGQRKSDLDVWYFEFIINYFTSRLTLFFIVHFWIRIMCASKVVCYLGNSFNKVK